MCSFLSQFKLENSFYCQERKLKNGGMLEEARALGFIDDWKPKSHCTYYATVRCNMRGRLWLKKNEKRAK